MRPVFKNLPDEMIHTTVGFAHGECIPIWQVPIKEFSQKKWNDGYGEILWEGEIYAPIDGTITKISENGNEYHIAGDNGIDVMIHLGVDTDKIDPKYYEIKTSVGSKVKTGEQIGYMDIEAVRKALICPVSYLIFTSGEEVRMLHHHKEVDQHTDDFFLCAKVEDRLL